MTEYEIRPYTPDPVTKAPRVSIVYKDADGDLYLYVDPQSDQPWLEIMSHGTNRRSGSYPKEPLTELSPEATEHELDEKLGASRYS